MPLWLMAAGGNSDEVSQYRQIKDLFVSHLGVGCSGQKTNLKSRPKDEESRRDGADHFTSI